MEADLKSFFDLNYTRLNGYYECECVTISQDRRRHLFIYFIIITKHNGNGNVILGFMNDSFGEHFLNIPLHAHINLRNLRGKNGTKDNSSCILTETAFHLAS